MQSFYIRLNKTEDISEEYIAAILAETAEGIANLQKLLEKNEKSRKTFEELIEKFVSTIFSFGLKFMAC